jgi:hypothetical protein
MEFALMKTPRSHNRISGRAWAGSLFLAAIATAALAGAAAASPLTPAAVRAPHRASGASGGQPKPGQVTWSVLPATANGPDHSRNLFSYGVVKPGSAVIDHVEIVNRSKQSAAFSIYATDAVGTTLRDVLLLAPPGTKPVDIGAWVSFPGGAKQLSTVIPAGKAIIESFTVNVPPLATPGDHTGAMVAQVGIPGKNGAGLAIVENYRIAVPIELRVPGAMHASVQVQSISTGFSDPVNPFGTGSATISYTVANTGNVRETGTQQLTVTGPFGQSSTVRPPRLPTILPGDSVRVAVSVPGLYPAGPMTAHVTVTPAWPARSLPLSRQSPIATGSASLFATPWSLVGFILLLVAIGAGVRQFLRWRRREHRAEIAAAAAKARRETERRLLGTKRADGAKTETAAEVKAGATAGAPTASAPAATDSGPEVASGGAQGSGSATE